MHIDLLEGNLLEDNLLEDNLLEARSHADKNPYITAVEYLYPYKNDKSVFISFCTIPKLGLNPENIYGTPTGIYSYPLKDKFNQFISDGRLEFATNRPYIVVFQNTSKNILNKSASSKDLDICIKILIEDNPKLSSIGKKYLYQNWYHVDFSKYNTIDEFNGLPIKPKYKTINYMDKIWNLTHNVAKYNAKLKGKIDSHYWIQNEWSRLLMLCGYDGAYDSGLGIIHQNEPCQAVFSLFSI